MADDLYRDFLQHLDPGGAPGLVAIYHAVRNIPYGSTGKRDARSVIEGNLGSCSGKHLLLSDLLRRAGHETRLITIFTHFNELVPDHPSYPAELRRLVETGEILDFHHFVRARADGHWVQLDATWHDQLAPYGFPVNADWAGAGDTRLAARPLRTYPPADDLIALKERLLAELPAGQRALRARFFQLLTEWIAGLPRDGDG